MLSTVEEIDRERWPVEKRAGDPDERCSPECVDVEVPGGRGGRTKGARDDDDGSV